LVLSTFNCAITYLMEMRVGTGDTKGQVLYIIADRNMGVK
jgi:hypothetical protein